MERKVTKHIPTEDEVSRPFVTSTGYLVMLDTKKNDPYVLMTLKSVENQLGYPLCEKAREVCIEEAIKSKEELLHFMMPMSKTVSELTKEERKEYEEWLKD